MRPQQDDAWLRGNTLMSAFVDEDIICSLALPCLSFITMYEAR